MTDGLSLFGGVPPSRWAPISNGQIADFDSAVVNHCVLVELSSSNRAVGFAHFPLGAIDLKFFERLKLRVEAAAVSSSRLILHLPETIRHRIPPEFLELKAVSFEFTRYVRLILRAGTLSVRSKIRAVCVDDSPLLLKIVSRVLVDLGYVEIIGTYSDPQQAIAEIVSKKPDLVTMDIQMPKMNGVQAVSKLMELGFASPIIMVSSLTVDDGPLVFDALNAGAFEYVQKPSHDFLDDFRDELDRKIQASLLLKKSSRKPAPLVARAKGQTGSIPGAEFRSGLIWCIGASTGGTQALTQVLTRLPSKIPPILIVQHIPPVFSKSFADSLNNLCPFRVLEAQDGMVVEQDSVYIAPGGMQMALEREAGRLVIRCRDDAPVNRFKPSVDYMFNSVAKVTGISLVSGILTGMGRDGADGLLSLKKQGAITFAQDEESSVVYGMPRAAFENGAASRQVKLEGVADFLISSSLLQKRTGQAS